jgi:hypothetical protein
MGEGEQVSGTSTSIANHNRHGWLIVHVYQDGLNGVGAAFDDQANQRYRMMILQCDF